MTKYIIFGLIAALLIFMLFRSYADKKQAGQNIELGQLFLAGNAKKEGVQTFESGLQMKVLQTGTGELKPNAKDKVLVHYHGTLIDGTVFDSSVERGEPISFPLNRVIPGWTEGLQHMVEGEKSRLFIPSNLAYGNRSAGKISAGSTLIFDVELLKINP